MFTALLVLNTKKAAIERIELPDGRVTTVLDGVSAVPDGIVHDPDAGRIYWTNMGAPTLLDPSLPPTEANLDFSHQNGSLETARTDGSDRRAVLPVGSLTTGKQLDADFAEGKLYWSDREGRRVSRANIDGSGVEDLVVNPYAPDTLNEPVGVAARPESGLLYWTQKGPHKGGRGRIFRAGLELPDGEAPDGRSDIETLWDSLPEPIDLFVDQAGGFLYWTDRGAAPDGNTLNRAPIPGRGEKGARPQILARGFPEPIGLAVDLDAGVVYVSSLGGVVRAVSLSDGSDTVIAQFPDESFTGVVGV